MSPPELELLCPPMLPSDTLPLRRSRPADDRGVTAEEDPMPGVPGVAGVLPPLEGVRE